MKLYFYFLDTTANWNDEYDYEFLDDLDSRVRNVIDSNKDYYHDGGQICAHSNNGEGIADLFIDGDNLWSGFSVDADSPYASILEAMFKDHIVEKEAQ